MSSYSLEGSYETVQVLGPTIVNDVVYCTISTLPSGVIASMPVQQTTFAQQQANVQLGAFADAIETIMNDSRVISAVGEQSIDPSGLIADNVVFTVQYVDPNNPAANITAEATVSVGQLDFQDALIGQTLLGQVDAIIQNVYDNLQSAASG